MRMILSILALAATLAAQTQTGTVELKWDAMPSGQSWTSVRIYERTGAAAPYTYTKVAEVPATATTATIPGVAAGVHTYVARSVNGWESADSNAAVTGPPPDTPTGFKATVTVTVTVQVQGPQPAQQ